MENIRKMTVGNVSESILEATKVYLEVISRKGKQRLDISEKLPGSYEDIEVDYIELVGAGSYKPYIILTSYTDD